MYSVSITRNGKVYRLDLLSSSSGSIEMSPGFMLVYEQQDREKRYQPSLRGSLKVTVVSDTPLGEIEGCTLYEDDAVIFKGDLNNFDDRAQLDNPVKIQSVLEFGDYLTTRFEASISSGDFQSSSDSLLFKRCFQTISEIFQHPINSDLDANIKSKIIVRVDSDTFGEDPHIFNWVDEPENLFFDVKPYVDNDISVLESLEDVCLGVNAKALIIGDQIHIIQENTEGFTGSPSVSVDYSDLLVDAFEYNTEEPTYNRLTEYNEADTISITINDGIRTLDAFGALGYVAMDTSLTEAGYKCYIQAEKTSGTTATQINSAYAHRALTRKWYFATSESFTYDIKLQCHFYSDVHTDHTFTARIILGFVDANGNHCYLDSNNDWQYRGSIYPYDGDVSELYSLYFDNHWTVEQQIVADSALLTFSGDVQTSVNRDLFEALDDAPNGTFKGGDYYLYLVDMVEFGGADGLAVDSYTIDSFSLTLDNVKYSVIEGENGFYKHTKQFDAIGDADTEDVKPFANNNMYGFRLSGLGNIGAREFDGATTPIKNIPYYAHTQPPYDSQYSEERIGFSAFGVESFGLSLDESIMLLQNTYSSNGIDNSILRIAIKGHQYISPLSIINFEGQDYFITYMETDLESIEGFTKLELINLNAT